jgi:ABC-type branched-subunit amino acid transport system permease subunit
VNFKVRAWEFLAITVGTTTCLYAIQGIGFNLQFGYAGIVNLAYGVLVAVGAYGTAIAAVHPAPKGLYTHYIGGFGWPFPADIAFGVACSVAFGALLGGLAFRRLRADYLAISMVVIGSGLWVLVNNDTDLVNGQSGIGAIPSPWSQFTIVGQLEFLALSAALLVVIYALFSRLTGAPLGRAFRAVREDEIAAAALAKNPWRLKLTAFLLGSFAAGVSGSMLALYIGSWNTSAWLPSESLILLAAIIVGGRGRHAGAVVGVVVVIGVISQVTPFLPIPLPANELASIQIVAIGLLVVGFLWWRPQGILPEQADRFRIKPSALPVEAEAELGRTST